MRTGSLQTGQPHCHAAGRTVAAVWDTHDGDLAATTGGDSGTDRLLAVAGVGADSIRLIRSDVTGTMLKQAWEHTEHVLKLAIDFLKSGVLPATLDGDDGDTLGEDGRASPVFIDDGVNTAKGALQ